MIEIENLTKRFDDHVAVDNLTLHIAAGEVFGFLGPNGAGKTTTVRMLTTLIAPTAGRASLMGYEVGRDDREIRRRVGLLTETPGMYDRLSAWKNLLIYARLYEVDNPERQAEKYLRMLDLWERRHDAAGTYSKGMKQKLAIARALLHEPPILFLDEPTAGLDPEASRMLRNFIGDLRGEGRTIFLCTHNLDEADRLCDRIAVFKSRLRVVDAPSNLRQEMYGRQIIFHLAHAAAPFLPAIAALPYIQQSEAEANNLLLSLTDPEQHNPDLIRRLVNAGADIQFVSEARRTLEEIYLQLVQEEGESDGQG
jgi:ABC-2 type transport system ATP-binding protein